MTFRKGKSNTPQLHEKWKDYGLNVDEITDKLNLSDRHLIPCNVLRVL